MSAGYFESTYQRIATIAHEAAVERKREEAARHEAAAVKAEEARLRSSRYSNWRYVRNFMIGQDWQSVFEIAEKAGIKPHCFRDHTQRRKSELESKKSGNLKLWRLK